MPVRGGLLSRALRGWRDEKLQRTPYRENAKRPRPKGPGRHVTNTNERSLAEYGETPQSAPCSIHHRCRARRSLAGVAATPVIAKLWVQPTAQG
jgi:hypothetical protein